MAPPGSFSARLVGGAAALTLLASPLSGSVAPPQFTDITASSGIIFRHAASKTTAKFLPETMGGGVALFDYDGDRRLDVFFTNGAAIDAKMTSLRQPDKRDPRFWNRLYRNVGGGTFADVTAKAGVAGRRYDLGAAVGDIDNDGDSDLYVTGYGANSLYRNGGDGTFAEVTREAGVVTSGWSSSAAFVDFDQDGWLDLFVGRYLAWSWEANIPCPAADGSGLAYCHPRQFPPIASVLYRNQRDGTFADVSVSAGLAGLAGKALGVAINDFDADGFVDLFVANDSMRQFLFRNTGRARFDEVALEAGVAYDDDGRAYAGMGTDFDDFDNDGRPDLVVTTLSLERYALYRNAGTGRFDYATHATGVGRATASYSGWGTKFIDFDNDGDRDLFVAQGHVLDHVTEARQGYDYLQPPLMLRNDGGRFVDASAELGAAFRRPVAGRGAAVGDLDADGDLDIVMATLDGTPLVLRNDGGSARPWVRLRLRGTASNRDGLGALITVTDGQGRQHTAVCSTASSYQSASDRRVHFGLGTASAISRIDVRWPSGATQTLTDVEANREIEVREPVRRR